MMWKTETRAGAAASDALDPLTCPPRFWNAAMMVPVRRLAPWLGLLLPATVSAAVAPPALPTLVYSIDLNRRADDLFHVTLRVNGLRPGNEIYQFAATAPGTYQVMNIGRYVKDFRAYDARGARVPAEQVSVNQWKLSSPAKVRTIRYAIGETWDSPLDHPIYRMCGSTLASDHVLINPHAVLGYPEGLQAAPVRLRLAFPAAWKVGTPLHRGPDGAFVAANYDQLVDSPILLGQLTRARLVVTGVPIDVYVYSMGGEITARQLLTAMSGMLNAAGKFLGRLPVDRYTFLYHFGDSSAGAWEHSYGSEYVLKNGEYTDSVGRGVTDIAAHEFFHVVTPLNIHSEIIEHFNFVTPVPSRHLWLYEGTTEWAAHAMQLRAGLKTPEQYLATQITKMKIDRQAFDSTYSLGELAMTSYSDSGQRQYGNIYMRGALTAGLLDIRLLELSHGRRGLQDLIIDLTHHFGKRRAFPDSTFVDTLVAMTSPEIRDFFDRYVWGSEHLPIKEYYAKLGITLVEDEQGVPVRFEIDPSPTDDQRLLREAWLGRKPRAAS
jgi:predicted metalloprotease with PDZ domain